MTALAMDAVVEPVLIPIDPESLDATRPVDLDVCPECAGNGAVLVVVDDEGDAVECWACNGTGIRGAA